MVSIKNKKEIEKMREACRIANLAQKAVEAAIRPGISTLELDKIAEDTMRKMGQYLQKKVIQVESKELWTSQVQYVHL